MKTILRIEHPFDGKGMFNSCKSVMYKLEKLTDLADRHRSFPEPSEDEALGNINTDEFCAFKSVSQLQEWVTKEEVRILHENGFVVLMIDVNECVEGEYQILYRKEDVISQKDVTLMFV